MRKALSCYRELYLRFSRGDFEQDIPPHNAKQGFRKALQKPSLSPKPTLIPMAYLPNLPQPGTPSPPGCAPQLPQAPESCPLARCPWVVVQTLPPGKQVPLWGPSAGLAWGYLGWISVYLKHKPRLIHSTPVLRKKKKKMFTENRSHETFT